MSKLEEFRAKARELAKSSNFYGWPPLEFELRFEEGYSDAREWLHLPSTRDELDRICQAARKRREARYVALSLTPERDSHSNRSASVEATL